MLIISRKDLESIQISPADNIDANTTIADLFRNGPIEITIFTTGQQRVKMGVQAPEQLRIWRNDAPTS